MDAVWSWSCLSETEKQQLNWPYFVNIWYIFCQERLKRLYYVLCHPAPGAVGHLSFTEILDTSLKVSWSEPNEKNGVLTGTVTPVRHYCGFVAVIKHNVVWIWKINVPKFGLSAESKQKWRSSCADKTVMKVYSFQLHTLSTDITVSESGQCEGSMLKRASKNIKGHISTFTC